MSLLPASDSSPPLQDVRTTIYIGTPDTIKPVCYRDLVSVTSSMSYNELYELLVASNPAAPRLEELEPCCLVSCQEGKQFNIPRTQRIFGFIRTCDPGEFNGALTVWFQPTSDPDLEYVGYGVQQQLAMTPTMRIKQHRSSANHLERQQRNIQKKQRLSSPATSTPSPGSGMLFSPPATSSSGSSGMLFSSPSFLSESSVSTQSTQLVASPDPDIVQPLSPPFASWSPDIQFWLRASEELSDKKMPGMSDLGEDMVQVFREYGLTPADNNNSKNMCQGVFDCLAWTAWCLDADRQLVTGSIPPMFQRLVEIAKARQSRGGSLSSPMAAGSLSAAGSGHDTKALQNLVGHSASFDGIITPLPKNIPWDTRRPRLYTGACGAQPQINRAAFVNDVLERLWKTANSFHPCSLSAIFGSDPSASALKKHKLYSTAVAAISLVDRVQSYHTVDAAQSRTSTSPSCIKKWWIQHPYQVGRSGVLAGDADNSAACHQENGSGSGSGNNNNNNTTTTTTTSNNSRSSSRSSSSSILDSTLESINVDQFLSVYDRHLIAVPIDKILPPHTSNMREYHHAVQHRLTASRTFAVFVAHRNRYHMRVFVAPVESEDEQSTIEMLSRRVELAYDALRVAEVCSQRENVVARFMFAQHQSQGSLGVSARAIVKEAGYFPPADDALFTATVDDIDMNGSMYDDATLLRMLVESLELAADYGLANGDLVDSRSRAMKATKAHTATTATEQYSRFEDFYLVADGLIEESKLAKAANDRASSAELAHSTIVGLYTATVSRCMTEGVGTPSLRTFYYAFLPPNQAHKSATLYKSRFKFRVRRLPRDIHQRHPLKKIGISTICLFKAMSFLLSSEEFGYKGYAVLMSADDKAKAHFSAPGKPGIALIRTLPVLTPVGDNTGELDNQLPRHGAGSHDYSVGIALVPSITAVCAIPATYPASFGVTHTSYSINDSAYSVSSCSGHCATTLSILMTIIRSHCGCFGGYAGELCSVDCTATTAAHKRPEIEECMSKPMEGGDKEKKIIASIRLANFDRVFKEHGVRARPALWLPLTGAMDYAISTCRGHLGRVLIIEIDGGHDRTTKFLRNRLAYLMLFSFGELDMLIVMRNAPGNSAYNPVEREMADFTRALSDHPCQLKSSGNPYLDAVLSRSTGVEALRDGIKKQAVKMASNEAAQLTSTIESSADIEDELDMDLGDDDVEVDVNDVHISGDSQIGPNSLSLENGGNHDAGDGSGSASAYSWRDDAGLERHISAELNRAREILQAGDFEVGSPEAASYAILREELAKVLDTAARGVIACFAYVKHATNIGPREPLDAIRLMLLILARCGISRPTLEMVNSFGKKTSNDPFQNVYAALDIHMRCSELALQTRRCDMTGCPVCGGPRDGDKTAFMPLELLTGNKEQDADPLEMAKAALQDREYGNKYAGSLPVHRSQGQTAPYKAAGKTSQPSESANFNTQTIRGLISCSSCNRSRGIYITAASLGSSEKKTQPAAVKYRYHVMEAQEKNTKWVCGSPFNSKVAGVFSKLACTGPSSTIETAVYQYIWKHNNRSSKRTFKVEKTAVDNSIATDDDDDGDDDDDNTESQTISSVQAILVPCYVCGVALGDFAVQRLSIEKGKGMQLPFCSSRCLESHQKTGGKASRAAYKARTSKQPPASGNPKIAKPARASSQSAAASQPRMEPQPQQQQPPQPQQQRRQQSVVEQIQPGEMMTNFFANDFGKILYKATEKKVFWVNSIFTERLFNNAEASVSGRPDKCDEINLYLFPILTDVHWRLMAVDLDKRKVICMDSFISNQMRLSHSRVRAARPAFERVAAEVFGNDCGLPGLARWEGIKKYEDGQSQFTVGTSQVTEKGFEWQVNGGWAFVIVRLESEQQNGIDCGFFMLAYAKALALGEEYRATREDMPLIRDNLNREVREGSLILDSR